MIRLRFCGFDSLVAKAIERFTDPLDRIGHVDIVMPNGTLLGAQHEDGLGGRPAGVQIRPETYLHDAKANNITDAVIPVTDAATARAFAFAMAQVGKPYDTAAIAGFISGRDWRSPDSWFCSELAAATLEAANVFPQPLVAPANKITPAALLLLCSAFGPVSTGEP